MQITININDEETLLFLEVVQASTEDRNLKECIENFLIRAAHCHSILRSIIRRNNDNTRS